MSAVLVNLRRERGDVLLSQTEVLALRELVEVYLADDGPAMECMPQWRESFAPEVLARLRDKVLDAFGEEEPRET